MVPLYLLSLSWANTTLFGKRLLDKNEDKEVGVAVCGLNQNKLRYWSRLMRLIFLPSRLFPASRSHGDKCQVHIHPLKYSLCSLFLPLTAIQVLFIITKDLDVHSKANSFHSDLSFGLTMKIPNPVVLTPWKLLYLSHGYRMVDVSQ